VSRGWTRWIGVSAFFALPALLLGWILYDGARALWPQRIVTVELDGTTSFVRPRPGIWISGSAWRWVERGDSERIGADVIRVAPMLVEQANIDSGAVTVERRDSSPRFGVPREQCDRAGLCVAFQREGWRAAHRIVLDAANGRRFTIATNDIVRVEFSNSDRWFEQLERWFRNLAELLIDAPRNANTSGGMGPALIGTSLLVLLMSAIVSPLGVLTALYLYLNQHNRGVARMARAAVAHLAAIPSVLVGAFVLVAGVYGAGQMLDRLAFADRLPSPTFGTGGLLWAALAMALLTLPIVVTVTLQGLERVPQALIEGSLALGTSREQTVLQLVLPLARGAFLTALVLAISRAAGEIAPLMLVGVVKSAPQLPLSTDWPYLHLEQKFMHLGHQLYDLAVHAPSFEAALPMLKKCAALLLLVVLSLNLLAQSLRARLIRDLERPLG
jgi:phosphate transport system permease protein